MSDPASSDGSSPPVKPPTVYITVDLSPSGEASKKGAKGSSDYRDATLKTQATLPHGPVLWEPPDPEELGRVLPSYTVLALLGSGGMGAVYRAKQKSLDRLVALKVLSPELAERAPEFTERFNNEAGALAKLSHPSIVHLFDCGRTKDGQLYIAMELVEGRDVADRLAGKQPLSKKEALSIALTVCAALEHAHQRGVIHRDIKPANVMLDHSGRVKITDFGLARIIQSAVPKARQTTTLLGTPRFTAPEALVPGAVVDERADIFSFGVMLYQMLTGEVPRNAAVPPSELMPEPDARFDAIVEKAMAERPDDRYADVKQLREALESVQHSPEKVVKQLPAATIVEVNKEAPKKTATAVARHTPSPVGEAIIDEQEWHEEHAKPSRLLPVSSTLFILAIAGLWAWQQWKHPEDLDQLVTPTTGRAAPAPQITASTPTTAVAPSASSPAPPMTAAGSSSDSASPAPTVPSPATPSITAPTTTSAPSAEELAQTQRRIGQIQGDFDAAVKEWQNGQDVKFAQLDVQYLRAVRTAITAKRNERKLADVAGLEEEDRYLSSKTSLPPLDATSSPERARLRGIYDGQVMQIARAGAETKVEIYNRLLGSLFAYQSILRQTSKPGSASIAAGLMDTAIKERDALRRSLNAFGSSVAQTDPAAVTAPVPDMMFGVVYEAEDIRPVVSAGTVSMEANAALGLSGSRQLTWSGGKLADVIVMPFDVPQTGRYRLEAALTKASGNGIFKFQLNSDMVGDPTYDLYAPGEPSVTWHTLYEGPFKPGRNELKARVMETNRSGPRGYGFTLDCLRLAPLQ